MQCSLISGYVHNFIEERTMMLKVFPDDDLRSTAHDRKKEQEKGIHMTSTTMMSSTSMLALLERGNVFVLGADTSVVEIGITLMQDGRLLIHIEASLTLHTRFLKGILIATKSEIWLDIGPWHEKGVRPNKLQSMLTPAHVKKK
ncbi:hypothetical protein B296_00011398 [Ensete ventricosum]|uniref:Uncharacterized protein n=1 Tax=Ensete ventricosum TaxID=4639 RepID=A0A426XW67_ENSVE|nr:hypothetical protein B296_00011398 [Ensete ventricosum]